MINAKLGSLLAGAMLAASMAAAAPADEPPAPATTTFKEIQWDDLIPKDWDPLKRFRDMNVGAVSDASPRMQELLNQMRDTWDNAPTIAAMNGANVKLPGYVVPLEEVKGGIKEFLLVPYFGACIHVPPPPANQIVHVISTRPLKGVRTMDAVWASGTLHTARQDSVMGMSGYRMQAAEVVPYTPAAKR
jgi:hypothetical protein